MSLKEEQSEEVTSKTNRKSRILKQIKFLRNVITVEPVMAIFFISIFLISISQQNLALEKSCRVNLAMDDLLCDAMMDKSKFGINCVKDGHYEYKARKYLEKVIGSNNSEIDSTHPSITVQKFMERVCWAEAESQKFGSQIRSYISPCESIVSTIVILFAGGWSDRKRRRIPLMLFPLIGQLLTIMSFLIGSIFMKQLPVEFVMVLGSLLEGIFGGMVLMFMGMFSYLTEVTSEENRTLRFSIAVQLIPIISMTTLPFSGLVYQRLGYIKTFSMAIALNAFGLLYILYCMKEPAKSKQNKLDENGLSKEHETEICGADTDRHSKKHFIVEFFDLAVVKHCYLVATKKRIGHRRKIVILMLLMPVFTCGPDWGELFNEYFFVRTKLNWEAMDEAPFATYASCSSFVGTFIMAVGVGKYLHITNEVVGIVTTFFGLSSKVVYIFATTSLMVYVAKTLDMFTIFRITLGRIILTSSVDKSETGRVYSLLGVLENISKIIFIPVYSSIYKITVSYYPNAYFILSFVCQSIVMILYIVTHVYTKQQERLYADIKLHQYRTSSSDCREMSAPTAEEKLIDIR